MQKLSQQLLEENSLENCWQAVLDCVEQSGIVHHSGIFKYNNSLTVPLAANTNQIWYEIFPEKTDTAYLKNTHNWGISYMLDKELLLHLEKAAPFTPGDLDFLKLIRNLYGLRWREFTAMPEQIKTFAATPADAAQSSPEVSRKDFRFTYPEIVGESQELLRVLATVDKIADAEIPVLIQGESGTGKELVAQALHRHSKRRTQPFISENCAAIPETLLESELFGYTRGSFTGALHDKPGLFEIAHKGTLFLDEVGDMSSNMQKKLLRALQNGEIRPIGSKSSKIVDVRLITATNKNLQKAANAGKFREDLYYRMNVVNLVMPALRQRGQDIVLLFEHFLHQYATGQSQRTISVADNVRPCLLQYSWPGNIRELQNEVRRILALLEGDTPVTIDMLSPDIAIFDRHTSD